MLEHLDLHLAPGETVALIGRTGSGKSTIARLLPRFYDVSEGAVLVDGHDVRDLTVRSLRAAIGLVLDEPFLFSASVRDNIAYGRPDASDDDVRAAARAAGAEEFIDALPEGFDSEVGERGYTLSGGQRQRVAIARTLLDDPAILILDDATSAIDVQVEEEIHAALRVLMEGRTTLVIAHRLSTINLAERVVLLEGGRIVADGTHAGLMATEPRYAEVLAHIEEDDADAAGPSRGGRRASRPARRAGRHGRRTAQGHRAGRPRLMAWGGGGWRRPGGFGGGRGRGAQRAPVRRCAAGAAVARRQAARARAGPRARAGHLRAGRAGRRRRSRSGSLLVPHRLALVGVGGPGGARDGRAAGRSAPHPDRDRRRHPRRRRARSSSRSPRCTSSASFVGAVTSRTRIAWTGRVGERLLYDLRVKVFSHFQRLSIDFFSREKAGRLMTRMTSDLDNLTAAPAGGVGPAVRAGPDDGVRDRGAVLDAARPRRRSPCS